MFYTYILRSISQPEQRYIGSTADLKASLAIRRFFLLAKISGMQRSGRRMPSIALTTEGKRQKIGEKRMFYTYILRSISQPEQRYIGSTADLKARLAKHNAGEVPHTSKFKPWKVEAYFAFETKEKATSFEAYLKTGSGHAFAKRHF